MKILASDLDNTLIYSYKHDIGDDKIVVEYYQGKEASYMTRTSYELLNQLYEKLLFVPITTRSIAQYERIQFHLDWMPHMALVSNGGTLLIDGKVDQIWKEETLRQISSSLMELERAEHLLEVDENRTLDVRRVDDVFVFTKSSDAEKTIQYLNANLDLEVVDCFTNGVKVYVLPKQLTKGNAVKRLKERVRAKEVIAAGDSMFDLSLLEQAELSYCPEQLKEFVSTGNGCLRVVPKNELLSDVLLQELNTMFDE